MPKTQTKLDFFISAMGKKHLFKDYFPILICEIEKFPVESTFLCIVRPEERAPHKPCFGKDRRENFSLNDERFSLSSENYGARIDIFT